MHSLSYPHIHPICVLDLGARPVEEPPSYIALEKIGLRVTGVDGSIDVESTFINQFGAFTEVEFFGEYLGTSGHAMLDICREPSVSTIMGINNIVCDRFEGLKAATEIISSVPVSTSRIDDMFAHSDFDLIKTDLQGADLAALSSGRAILSRCCAVVIECEFVKQFRDGPLFWEVVSKFDEWGFEFHSVLEVGIRPRLGFDPTWSSTKRGYKQWLWGDALFMQKTEQWSSLSPLKLARFSVIMDLVFSSYDISYSLIRMFDTLAETNFAEAYASALRGVSEQARLGAFKNLIHCAQQKTIASSCD